MKKFNNHYLIMRHGESEANVAGLIVSDPAIGCKNFGLTDAGRRQVVASISDYQLQNSTTKQVAGRPISKVICSDFLRTTETANLSTQTLFLSAPQIEPGLRERFFGDWEGKSDIHYPEIWALDDDAQSQAAQQIESVDEVRQRGLAVIEKLDAQFSEEVILLVSHGDMLQILLTAFADIPAQQHRTLPHHAQAEIKLLVAGG
ncbi:MAG: putative phosphoglycerate mutase [Cellvibrionaceae bacterium]|jgi:probable phosphoglycerate mutase